MSRQKHAIIRVRCETCPIQDFCLCQTMATCPLLKLVEKLKEKEKEDEYTPCKKAEKRIIEKRAGK